MPTPNVIAILCSDLHLSLIPPSARSAESDWLEAQARQLKQLRELSKRLEAPVVCAGDVFHHWRSPPELVNFAIEHLPKMYAVPGQHDLPYHNLQDLDKSAYGTLMRAGKITNLEYLKPRLIKGAWLWGFPWGAPVVPLEPSDHFNVAVVHAYIWQHKASFPGAKETDHVGAWRSRLEGYRVALFGDNHKPFFNHGVGCAVFNHGAFQRRAIDEEEHRPALGLLTRTGKVILHELDVSADKFIVAPGAKFEEEEGFTMKAFLKELSTLQTDDELSFQQAVQHYLQKYEVSPGAKSIVQAILDYDQSE